MRAHDTSTPAISFIIPVRNDAPGLERCLRAISRASAGVDIECIVLDNGSTDGSASVAEAAGCRVMHAPGERVGALRNRGAAIATGSLLAFVDADHEVHPAWTAATLDTMSDTSVAAAGAPYASPSSSTWVQRTYNGLRDHRLAPHMVEWLGSGNLVVRRQIFTDVGGFDTSLEACEDVDLCRRIRVAGGVIVSESRMRSVHHGDPTTLAALFRSELWRGRNNLQVSLRERPSLRALPSVVVPVVQLASVPAAAAISLAGFPTIGALVVAGAMVPTLARALTIRRRTSTPAVQALAVACTYDAARALALVLRTGHRRAAPSAFAVSQ
jgi:GT2 family glycosyltransferase